MDLDTRIKILENMVEIDTFLKIYNLSIEKVDINSFSDDYIKCCFEYRLLALCVIGMISTWEQQLYKFVRDKYDNNINNNYNDLKDKLISNLIFNEEDFNKIKFYRYLVNVLKHGEKSSYYKKLPKRFIETTNSGIYETLNKHFCFSTPVLNLNKELLEEINKELREFWRNINKNYKDSREKV